MTNSRSYILIIVALSFMVIPKPLSSKERDSLISITRQDFSIGKKVVTSYFHDKKVRKAGHVMYLSNSCPPISEDTTDEAFFELSYLGDLNKEMNLKVVKKTLYNGVTYIVIDTKNRCNSQTLFGKPVILRNRIITMNESETTDIDNFIDVRSYDGRRISYLRRIDLPKNVQVKSWRISRKGIFLSDFAGKFWEVYLDDN